MPTNTSYLDAIASAHTAVLEPYLTTRCTECGELADPNNDNSEFPHLFHRRRDTTYVVGGCEGFWLINPDVLGFGPGRWIAPEGLFRDDPNAALTDTGGAEVRCRLRAWRGHSGAITAIATRPDGPGPWVHTTLATLIVAYPRVDVTVIEHSGASAVTLHDSTKTVRRHNLDNVDPEAVTHLLNEDRATRG